MKQLLKTILQRTKYRISASGALNRFDAIDEVMNNLKARGFRPTQVVDGGANIGDFARRVRQRFPSAKIHLIEPQPGCQASLQRIAEEPGFVLHPVALVAPAQAGRPIAMATTSDGVNTGAHIDSGTGVPTVDVAAATLDQLFAGELGPGDHLFLKLDLQGYELEALSGGARTLEATEVILTEVSFFAQAYEPPIATLIAYLETQGFSLYDIAALSGRARDGRARQGDFVFVRRSSPLMTDTAWA